MVTSSFDESLVTETRDKYQRELIIRLCEINVFNWLEFIVCQSFNQKSGVPFRIKRLSSLQDIWYQ